MAHESSPENGPSSAEPRMHAAQSAGQLPFSPGEWATIQNEDKKAATHIVCLMAGIFFLGVVGYLGVFFWVG